MSPSDSTQYFLYPLAKGLIAVNLKMIIFTTDVPHGRVFDPPPPSRTHSYHSNKVALIIRYVAKNTLVAAICYTVFQMFHFDDMDCLLKRGK